MTRMAPAQMRPYGLRHQVQLRPVFTQPPPVRYDPARQLNMLGTLPLVHQPELMARFTVTWGTTANDNKTDDGG